LHLAGYVTIFGKPDERTYNINVNGTKNMLQVAKTHHVKRFVYASTVHAIPELETGKPIREVDHFDPDAVHGYYAKTKAMATQLVMDAAKEGMDALVVHPSGIIGPYDYLNSHTTRLFRRLVDKKLPGMVSGGYDFVDVRDVADGIIRAALNGEAGEAYILSGGYYPICDIVNIAAKMAGRKQFKITVPRFLAKIAAPFVEWSSKVTGTPPIFTSYSLYTLNSFGKFSNEKARKALGYTTRPIRETVRDTLEFMRKNEQFSTSFIFQRNDMRVALLIDLFQQTRQRCRLSASRRTGDENHSPSQLCQIQNLTRYAHFLRIRQRKCHHPYHGCIRSALLVRVDTETRYSLNRK
jgi:dihydroflavonol-4-reductase